jgi:DNA polymerase-3 subunit gamma/tau
MAIDAGRFVDYIEMDAASNRGVDEMAALLEQAVYSPSNARFKVYMIDEVHMLTNHAFNSMLKTLEEPPPHVKFILATTDPQKIPVTVLSRCLQFNLKQMPPGHIVGHLENLLGQEQIAFEVPALRLLAKGAQGSMRDALSLTDQAIAYAAGTVSLDAVQNMLGALDQSYLIRLLDALAQQDGQAMLAIADEMAARSLSYKAALQDLGSLLHQIAVAQTVPAAIADDLPEREEVLRLAGSFSAETIQLFYQIVVHGRNELGLAPDEYAGFSMTLLRLLAFLPVSGASSSTSSSSPPPLVTNSGSGQTKPKLATAPVASMAANAVANTAAPATKILPAAEQKPVVNNFSQATVAVDQKAAKLSPAMAALAAARAGSQKAKDNERPSMAQPVSQAPVTVVKAPVPDHDVPPTVANIAPPIATTVQPVQQTSMQSAMSADDQGMPPPWDEEVIEASMGVVKSDVVQKTDLSEKIAPPLLQSAEPVESAAPAEPVLSEAKVMMLVPNQALNWDGDWPSLARTLNVRGVAQQLAQQSELNSHETNGDGFIFKLQVPVQTLLAAGSVEKLEAELTERFQRTIKVEPQLGAVNHTSHAQIQEERAASQLVAENAIQNDSFVQALMREFGAQIVTGNVRPA